LGFTPQNFAPPKVYYMGSGIAVKVKNARFTFSTLVCTKVFTLERYIEI
jgi:hypothetical protein